MILSNICDRLVAYDPLGFYRGPTITCYMNISDTNFKMIAKGGEGQFLK